jgi:hypothetical protein
LNCSATYKDLPPTTYTVTFNLNVAGATITFNGHTNSAGNYVFTGVASGTYTYSITREGYDLITGTMTVSANTAVTVTLIPSGAELIG